jgi:Sugar (and other) transporter.
LGCALSQGAVSLTIFRLTSGIAVGAGSVLAPMYISEVSPAAKRGTLVSFNQFAVTIGILLAYFIDYGLVDLENSWRYMLGAPFVFSLIFLVLLLVSFPESPRWLLSKGKGEEALKVLNKINPQTAQQEYDSIKSSLDLTDDKSDASFTDIFKGRLGVVVFIGTLLAMFQQITGINAIINYAPVILSKTGIGADASMLQSIFVGVINVLFTIVALWLIDIKRKKDSSNMGCFGNVIVIDISKCGILLRMDEYWRANCAFGLYSKFRSNFWSSCMGSDCRDLSKQNQKLCSVFLNRNMLGMLIPCSAVLSLDS